MAASQFQPEAIWKSVSSSSAQHTQLNREVRQLISDITKVIGRHQQNRKESHLVNQAAEDNRTLRDEGVIGTNDRIKEEDRYFHTELFLTLCACMCMCECVWMTSLRMLYLLFLFHVSYSFPIFLTHRRVKYLYSTSNHNKFQEIGGTSSRKRSPASPYFFP